MDAFVLFKSLGILAVASLFCGSVWCHGETLTWEDCVILAARNNPDILSAAQTLKSSGHQVSGAYSGFFPQLTGSLNYNYSGTLTPAVPSSPGSPGGFAVPFVGRDTTTSVYSASLTGTQNLFSGLQDKA